jgi:hypothetical protein
MRLLPEKVCTRTTHRHHHGGSGLCRCKTPGQCDQWLQFFGDSNTEADRLLKMHEEFRENLALSQDQRATSPALMASG